MPDLKAKFSLLDNMSSQIERIASAGMNMVERFEQAGDAANSAFDGIESGVSSAVSAVDGVATSIGDIREAAGDAATAFSDYGSAAEQAAGQAEAAANSTDYWTEAVGNYNTSLLEAVYSTEELVEMGLKSSDALKEQEEMFELCEKQAQHLSSAIEASADIQGNLEKAIEDADKAISDLTDDEKVSADTKKEFEKASEAAADALQELTKAQQDADAAMQNYDEVMMSGTTDLEELEAAAEQACHAAEALAEANGKATEASGALAQATEKVTEEAENAGQGAKGAGESGMDAINGIASALAAAGIVDTVKDIAAAAYELADSFSEANKTIIASTGATGDELRALQSSAQDIFADSTAETLNDVAEGMMSVKTATNLTGEALEEATEAGLKLENLFGYELGESSRTASALMKNFSITAEEAYDIIAAGAQNGADKNGDMLDILNEYSAQYAALGLSADEFISSLVEGANAGVFSIDKVGDAVKEFNIRAKDGSDTSAEAFELLGMNAEIMTARFAAGGETARDSFYEVVNALEAMDDPVQKNAAAVGLFGTMYEDLEANLLPILSNIEGGTVDVGGALESTAASAESLGDKWQRAGNSIQTAFTSAIAPTLTKASSGIASVVEGIGDFLQEHPTLTKAIVAIGTGLGVAAVGVAGVAAASLTAIPAVAAFGTALNAAIWPLTAVAAGVAAVAGAVLILKGNYDDAYDETMSMTAVTAKQTAELENLQAEYEAACEKYGETSAEASSLKYKIDELSASLEENGKSVEELVSECDALIEEHNSLMQEIDEGTQAVKDNELGNLALITRLTELASSTETTAGTQKEMEAIIEGLNGSIDGLNVSYSDLINNQEETIASIRNMAEAQAEQQRQQEKYDEYVKLIKQQAEEQEKLAEVTDEVAAAEQRASEAAHELNESHKKANGELSGWKMFWSWTTDEQAANDAAQDALDEVTAKQEQLQATLDETTAKIAEIEGEWENVGSAANDATEQTMTYEEAAATAYESVRTEIEELCAAYDKAYEAALASFEGQFGLFDEASTNSEEYLESTVANAQAALDSQLAYWEEYNSNLEALKAYSEGLTGEAKENFDALVQYASDGSEQAAGLADSIAAAIESGDQAAVENLANTVASVAEQQEAAAATTADWKTNFSAQMDEIQQKMNETVSEMNLSDEAAASATSTINGYADAIRAGKGSAVAAAQEVASAVTAALKAASTTINVGVSSSGSVSGHANGTTNAESVFLAGENGPELIARPAAAYATGTTDSTDYFIAGENGPELIVGEQGSTVFPTEETDRLINALNDTEKPLQIRETAGGSEGREKTSEQVKRILLEIAGSGAIEVGGNGGADKETILEMMYDHLKPVLMNIIQSEIYEEGELSYEY